MSGLKILLVICISVFVGNVVLMLLENAPMNIWIIRLIGGVACAISGILLTNYFQKKKSQSWGVLKRVSSCLDYKFSFILIDVHFVSLFSLTCIKKGQFNSSIFFRLL